MNMSNQLIFTPSLLKVWFLTSIKATALILSAIIATLGLFVIMSKLIANNNSFHPVDSEPFTVSIDGVREDSNTNKIVKVLPKPPEVKPIPKPTTEINNTISDDNSIRADDWTFELGGIDTQGSFSNGLKNMSAVPIVRVTPAYPIKAATQGIEGWVSLSFSINEIGKVIDVSVVDAEPKRIFDKEAKKALKKWKYKPQLTDGKAVVQTNQFVMLEFKMNET